MFCKRKPLIAGYEGNQANFILSRPCIRSLDSSQYTVYSMLKQLNTYTENTLKIILLFSSSLQMSKQLSNAHKKRM